MGMSIYAKKSRTLLFLCPDDLFLLNINIFELNDMDLLKDIIIEMEQDAYKIKNDIKNLISYSPKNKEDLDCILSDADGFLKELIEMSKKLFLLQFIMILIKDKWEIIIS